VTVAFGRALREHWALDPEAIYLNHGTVGATPRRVLAAQQALRDEMERHPSRFLLRETAAMVGCARREPSRLREAAARVATFLGARGDDLAFVDNATTGANAVLMSLALAPGDEIVVTDHGYGGVTRAVTYWARRAGATVRTVELPYPGFATATALQRLREALGPRTRLAVLDHVTSESALVLPLAEMAAVCRHAGVAVLADGAHAPGAIDVDIPALGVDWYTANLHKWAWAPRSSGCLWAAPARQRDLHPPVISWGLDTGFLAEFDWVGTRDPTPWLAAPAALDFMQELGVRAVRDWNHALAVEADRWLRARWGTPAATDAATIGTMVSVPLPASCGGTRNEAEALRDSLLTEDGIEVPVLEWRGTLYVRVSAQVYNDMRDVERLGEAILRRA